MKKQLLWSLLATLPLLHGCAGLVVAGAATTAVVANDRRTFGSVIDDQNIELKAANVIAERKDITKASRISATSMNGMVLLVGQTPYDQFKRESEQLVAKVGGVRHVYNELRIRKPIPFDVQSTDAWITSKIKSQMLTTKGVDSTRFKVVTENGEVFLMGLVTRSEADKAINIARHVSGVKKVVKVLEYVQGDSSSGSASSTPAVSTESNAASNTTSAGDVQMGGTADEVIKY